MTHWGLIKEWFSFKGSGIKFADGGSQSSRFLPQARRIVGSGGENAKVAKKVFYFPAHAQTKVSLAQARWKTRNIDQNLQRNNVARQVEGFCISYFAALILLKTVKRFQFLGCSWRHHYLKSHQSYYLYEAWDGVNLYLLHVTTLQLKNMLRLETATFWISEL